MTSCSRCGHETSPGYTLCHPCTRTLRHALRNTATYFNDLELLRGKRTRYGNTLHTRTPTGKTQPLLVDARFLDGTGTRAEEATRTTVRTWTRKALATWPPIHLGVACQHYTDPEHPCPHRSCREARIRTHPNDTVTSCCTYLARMLGHIVHTDWARSLTNDLLTLEVTLRHLIDRPRDLWYAGTCGATTWATDGSWQLTQCDRPLYADDRPVIRCPDCGTTHDVDQRRDQLLIEAEDKLVTIRTIARIVPVLAGHNLTETQLDQRIRTWVHRRRLTPRGTIRIDGRQRSTYRVGDVLDLLDDEVRTKQANAR